MSSALETFLARLYADPEALSLYLRYPEDCMREAGLSSEDCAAMRKADVVGLKMAARSYANKRTGRKNGYKR